MGCFHCCAGLHRFRQDEKCAPAILLQIVRCKNTEKSNGRDKQEWKQGLSFLIVNEHILSWPMLCSRSKKGLQPTPAYFMWHHRLKTGFFDYPGASFKVTSSSRPYLKASLAETHLFIHYVYACTINTFFKNCFVCPWPMVYEVLIQLIDTILQIFLIKICTSQGQTYIFTIITYNDRHCKQTKQVAGTWTWNTWSDTLNSDKNGLKSCKPLLIAETLAHAKWLRARSTGIY